MRRRIKNQDGQSLILVALMIVVLAGGISLAFDLGRAHLLKAKLQRAADAAALAGVRELPYIYLAGQTALQYSERNGFLDGTDGIVVNTYPHPAKSNWYVVELSKPSKHFFARLLGINSTDVMVKAVAEYNAYLPIDITGGGEYGSNGVMTLSMFGPYGYYSYGDAISPKWLNNGTPNPDYNPNGYNFSIKVPDDYYTVNGTNMIKMEIFDPDTWNNGGDDAYPGVRIDEIRPAPASPHPQPSNRRNTTVYSLYAPDNTPNNYSDDILVAQATYGPDVSATDMKWVTPSGFEFNINSYGTGKYRMNIKATDGSSENGFNLRAGPPAATFNPNNGTSVTAVGALPINFNNDGLVTVRLGYVPSEAAGKNMHVNKFDTDVGAKSIVYTCDSLSGQWAGTLSSDGTWKEDLITIPDGYSGGNWTATYVAGLQDTSVWKMWFEGVMQGQPGFVRLVE